MASFNNNNMASRYGQRSFADPNPFSGTPAANAHTQFTPSRVQPEAVQHGMALPKPPKPPEKPLVPYMRFSRQVWHKVREENKDCQVHEIGRKIGEIWRSLPESEKAVYQSQWETEKVEYDQKMKAYHNSGAYQSYLAAKTRAETLPKMKDNRNSGRNMESGVFIQPVDEDNGEHQVSVRRQAHYRYQRNQNLIGELMLNDSVVNDSRTVVTQQRISMLKRQASSLTAHQKNLENELVLLEEKFQKKKKMIEDASSSFSDRLKEVNDKKPAVTESKYDQMVVKATARLASAYEHFKKQQVEAVASGTPGYPFERAEAEADTPKQQARQEGNMVPPVPIIAVPPPPLSSNE